MLLVYDDDVTIWESQHLEAICGSKDFLLLVEFPVKIEWLTLAVIEVRLDKMLVKVRNSKVGTESEPTMKVPADLTLVAFLNCCYYCYWSCWDSDYPLILKSSWLEMGSGSIQIFPRRLPLWILFCAICNIKIFVFTFFRIFNFSLQFSFVWTINFFST